MTRWGLRVAAGKLTGVSLRRDVLQMRDSGASPVAIFTDLGVVTTSEETALGAAHALIAHLAEAEPDVLVLEMGDGLLGSYGVAAILADPGIQSAIRATILCAQDPVGAWGAREILRDRFHLAVDVVAGRITDGPTGVRFCRESLGVAACNALRDGACLADVVLAQLAPVGVHA